MFEHPQKSPRYPEGTVLVYFVTFTEIVMLFPWYFTLSFVVPFVISSSSPSAIVTDQLSPTHIDCQLGCFSGIFG